MFIRILTILGLLLTPTVVNAALEIYPESALSWIIETPFGSENRYLDVTNFSSIDDQTVLDINLYALENTFGMDYSATWFIDSTNGTVMATNVSCQELNTVLFNMCEGWFVDGGLEPGVRLTIYDAANFDIVYEAGEPSLMTHTFSFEAPIPSAVWFFSSALIGLAGVNRKN